MPRILLSLFLFTICCTTLLAQNSFSPGYIIQKGDTIRGLVSQKGVIKSGNKVIFQPNKDGASTTFTPVDIDGYGLQDGDRFEAMRLGEGDTAKYLFFKLLVLGKTSLYSFRDEESKVHYYVTQNGITRELVRKKERRTLPSGQKVEETFDLYKGTLQELTQDCPALQAARKDLSLTQKDLTAFIVEYNQCNAATQIQYIATPDRMHVTWGAMVGGATSTLKVESLPTDVLNTTYKSNAEPMVGLFLNATLPWISKKLSFQFETLYNQMSYENQAKDNEGVRVNEYEVAIDLHYLKFPISLKYTIPLGKIQPFLNVGIAYSLSLKHSQRVHVTSTTLSGNVSQEDRYLFQTLSAEKSELSYRESFRNYSQSVLIGGGVKLPLWKNHSITLETRYEAGNGFAELVGTSTRTNQFSLLAGFSF